MTSALCGRTEDWWSSAALTSGGLKYSNCRYEDASLEMARQVVLQSSQERHTSCTPQALFESALLWRPIWASNTNLLPVCSGMAGELSGITTLSPREMSAGNICCSKLSSTIWRAPATGSVAYASSKREYMRVAISPNGVK